MNEELIATVNALGITKVRANGRLGPVSLCEQAGNMGQVIRLRRAVGTF